MKVFEHFNQHSDDPCPICGTKDDLPVVLIPIAGTVDSENHIAQAIQVHEKCLMVALMYFPAHKIIYALPMRDGKVVEITGEK